MGAALSRTRRRLPLPSNSKLLCYSAYSTTPRRRRNSDFRPRWDPTAQSAILSESDPDKLAQAFIQYSDCPAFQRQRFIYQLSIRKLADARRFDLIDAIVQAHLKSPSALPEGLWIRLIMLYSSAGMIHHAMRTLHHLIHYKYCHLSEKSLCAVLSLYLHNSLPEKVHEMFTCMPEKLGVTPTVLSHNLVLKAFVQQDDLQSARNWIQQLYDDYRVAPNIDSYNILLGAYLNNRDWVAFDEIAKEISNKGLEFKLATYNHMISRLCENKECARANKMLDEMVMKGVKPSFSTYDTIIHGFCNLGDTESATKVVRGMLADGYVSPSSRIYYTLIQSMVKEGEFDSALVTCRAMMERRWVPPFEAMDGLVRGLVNMSRVEEAKEVVDKMKKVLKGSAVVSWEKVKAALPL